MNLWRRRCTGAMAVALVLPFLPSCEKEYPVNPDSMKGFQKLTRLMEKNKWMCFGRYAAQVPLESQQELGFHDIAGGFKIYDLADYKDPDELLRHMWSELTGWNKAPSMEGPIADGPIKGSRYFWFYGDDYEKRQGYKHLRCAARIGSRLYSYRGFAVNEEQRPATLIFSNMADLMRGMRPWDGVEVPRQPGVCIEGAFIHEPTNRFQEIMSSGFYFPSLPDVSFSVMSNKNASVEGDNGKGLLQMVDEARRDQLIYPYTFLRRGKRTLHDLWDGEEVLARRSDGALMFDWELVGEPGNVARPSSLEIGLRTKVADNKVGASPTSSLSDDEAVALWDHLLENVKFRVAVPGATPQSVALR